jgi:hypothetical protein
MMRTVGIFGVIVGLTLAAAPRAALAKDVKPPPELIASFARGGSTSLDGVRAFVNAIKPGGGAMITDQILDMGIAKMTGVAPLEGLDHNAAMYILYVDGGGTKGFAVVGKVSDPKQLPSGTATAVVQQNGWAVLGPANVIKKVSSYSFAALAPATAPAVPTVTIYTAAVTTRYKSEIETFRKLWIAQMQAQGSTMSGMAEGYIDGILSVASDSDRAILALDADQDGLTFDFALAPKPGSRLAKFVAAQHPSDYAMLGQLPASTPMMLFAGHFEAGPYRDGILDVMSAMYGAGGAKDLVAQIDAMMKASTGEMAFSMDVGGSHGMAITSLVGISDRKAADAAMGKLLDSIAKPRAVEVTGVPVTLQATPGTSQHDGVAIRGYDTTYDLAKLPEQKRKAMALVLGGSNVSHTAMAVMDKLAVFAIAGSGDAVAAAGTDIDVTRGKGSHYAPPKDVERMIDASRARKDSGLAVLDFGAFAAMMPTPSKLTGAMVMSIGFADGAAHMRMSMATATFKAAAKQP